MKKKNTVSHLLAAGCCLCLLGCVTKAPQEQVGKETAQPAKVEVKKIEAPPEKDPCDVLLDEMVRKASHTMKTVKASCRDLKVEVTPMWDAHYDGTVHIRIHDPSGKKIRDDYQKP